MKVFITSFFLLFPSLVFGITGDVYYCTEDENIGYDVSENYKIGKFKLERFKIKIDFNNYKISSKPLYFQSHVQQK